MCNNNPNHHHPKKPKKTQQYTLLYIWVPLEVRNMPILEGDKQVLPSIYSLFNIFLYHFTKQMQSHKTPPKRTSMYCFFSFLWILGHWRYNENSSSKRKPKLRWLQPTEASLLRTYDYSLYLSALSNSRFLFGDHTVWCVYKEAPVLNNTQFYRMAALPASQKDDRAALRHLDVVPG